MSIKWCLVIVCFVQELLAERVQLYGVDVDSLIQELHNTKNQLRGLNQVDLDDLNYDDVATFLDEASRSKDPAVSQKLNEEQANRDALNQIFNYYSKPKSRHELVKKSRHHHEHNELQKLLNLVKKSKKFSESTESEQEDTLSKSKIYVLDMENLKNIQMLNNAVNSLPNTKKSQRDEIPKQMYKGFVVHNSRRASRDSNEVYANKDSLESDYKPAKRPRDHFAGRTAIPYIKNRGDIYERDEKY